MSEDTTTRDIITRALYNPARAQQPGQVSDYHPEAEAALFSLATAGWEVRRAPAGRWGFYLEQYPDHVCERYGEDSARRGAAVAPGRVVVRWPHGGTGWEVVP